LLLCASNFSISPDVILLNLDNLPNEPLFEKQSTVTQAASIPLAIEVVSTNWRDDYYKKFGDYEEMGISEFWIADYKALGGHKFIGDPKQPTIFVAPKARIRGHNRKYRTRFHYRYHGYSANAGLVI
jgi:Uma2 family endonuclease